MEYDPQSPFQTGSPERAGPDLIEMVALVLQTYAKDCLAAVKEAREARAVSV